MPCRYINAQIISSMAEVSTVPAYILSNEHLLHWMLQHPLRQSLGIGTHRDYAQEFAYVNFHSRNAARPDHVFIHRWENFCKRYLYQQRSGNLSPKLGVNEQGECSLVLACLDCLVDEFLEFSHGEYHVRLNQFGWWQNMLSRMSALPIQAHAMWHLHEIAPAYGAEQMNATPALFYPYDEGVENYIADHGLNDSHIHVNLVGGGEISWLHTLHFLKEEISQQQESYDNNRMVRELYQEIYVGFTPSVLHQHLSLARRIRYLLMRYAEDKSVYLGPHREDASNMVPLFVFLTEIDNRSPLSWGDAEVIESQGRPEFPAHREFFHTPDVLKERRWMAQVLKRLSYAPHPYVDRLLHIYLLIMNEYFKLFVQQEDKYGFRQFNKYSQNASSFSGEIRYYEHVFLNMHGGGYHSITNYAELRIAPSRTKKATQERILKILHGYLLYLGEIMGRQTKVDDAEMDVERVKLAQTLDPESLLHLLDAFLSSPRLSSRVVRPVIVLHLIKKERQAAKERGDVRFGPLRRRYHRQLEDLLGIFRKYPELRRWVRGIDTAADEMDTPPDTFAAIYRYARHHLGIRYATYHAGEDFYHLISGIRNVCDVVDILEYRRGDRIGHATALGVDPALWMHTMPDCVTPTRGEWLQDLVFLWALLHDCENMHDLTRKLDYDIREQGYAVFHSPTISPYLLRRVFELRKLDPIELHRFYEEQEGKLTDWLIESREERQRDFMLGVPAMVSRIRTALQSEKQDRWSFSGEEQMVRNSFRDEAPEILALLMAWFWDEETWARAAERIEVPTDYLSVKELVLIQQMAMKHLVEMGVVLETMPTSNLRIAQYREMGQHHSSRWLGANAFPGDSPPPIVLGTDDPGVFATDIKAEFYHLYASLCKRGINSQAALEKLIAMNLCGERYAFRSLRGNNVENVPPVNFDIALSPDSPGYLEDD